MSSTFKTFPSPFLIIILTSLVNCRNEEQRTIQSSMQDTMGKKGKAPSSEEKEMRPCIQTLPITETLVLLHGKACIIYLKKRIPE